MPKKTKQEKILARDRRIKLLQDLYSRKDAPPIEKTKVPKSSDSQPISVTPVSIDQTEQNNTRRYFIADLRKSLLFIGIIIALEITVYFGTINNYFKF